MNTKKIFYISFFVIYIFLVILNILPKDKKSNKINTFATIPFYKETLQNEYQEYKKKTNYSDKLTVLYVNIGLNKPFYEDCKMAANLYTNYILVNKYNYLTKDYIPNNLVILDEYAKPGIRLNSEAYNNFKEMARDAKKNNLNLRIISAYRSFEYQENLYNSYLKYDNRETVDTYSARAGFSEHQTGLVIDIDNIKESYTKFHLTEEFNWMQKNAYKYGFILRYPRGKEYITGYNYESWHYRYVGKVIAKYIHEYNITFEEYYYEFIDKKNNYFQ